MKKLVSIIMVAISLTGCAVTPNFKPINTLVQDSTVNDLYLELDFIPLFKHYAPPAKTTLAVYVDPKDEFNRRLLKQLRTAGYALTPITEDGKYSSEAEFFTYKLDQILTKDGKIISLVIRAGNKIYSKMYIIKQGSLVNSTPWNIGEIND